MITLFDRLFSAPRLALITLTAVLAMAVHSLQLDLLTPHALHTAQWAQRIATQPDWQVTHQWLLAPAVWLFRHGTPGPLLFKLPGLAVLLLAVCLTLWIGRRTVGETAAMWAAVSVGVALMWAMIIDVLAYPFIALPCIVLSLWAVHLFTRWQDKTWLKQLGMALLSLAWVGSGLVGAIVYDPQQPWPMLAHTLGLGLFIWLWIGLRRGDQWRLAFSYTVMALNLFMLLHIAPALLRRDMTSQAGRIIQHQARSQDSVIAYQITDETERAHLSFRAQHTLQSQLPEAPPSAPSALWIYCDQSGFETLQKRYQGHTLKLLKAGDHFPEALLTSPLLGQRLRKPMHNKRFVVSVSE